MAKLACGFARSRQRPPQRPRIDARASQPCYKPFAMTMRDALKDRVKDLGDFWFWRRSQSELRSLLRRYPSGRGADILAISKQYRGHGWYKRLGAYQVEEEFGRLADWAVAQQPETVIEIGTAQGATLLLWARVAKR